MTILQVVPAAIGVAPVPPSALPTSQVAPIILDAIDQSTLSAVPDRVSRFGHAPNLFTSALGGTPETVAELAGDASIVTSAFGLIYRVTGAFVGARRVPLWLEPSRVFMARWAFARHATPTDPAGDSVQCGLAWLDASCALISTLAVNQQDHLVGGSGLRTVSARVPSQTGDPVAVVPPAGTVFFRPYIKTYGSDGVTDLVAIGLGDVTDTGAYSPDLTALLGRVTALEGQVASLSPPAAGVANGLATLDGAGHLVEAPSTAAMTAFVTALPGEPPAGAGWWSNGGIPTYKGA